MGKSDQGVETSQGRYTVLPRVLVFVFRESDVLLLKGAPTKRLWANRYNGLGGHVEAGEDVYSAARREVMEEAGLAVRDLRLRGVVNVDAGQTTGILFFVFSARCDTRATRASEEGTLEWVPLDRIGRYDLVEDLPVLLVRVQGDDAGERTAGIFFARYWYDAQDRLQITFAPS
jgi:8-oxo-dGTP diphosphatase